jgi:hypothetical protein
MLAIHTAFEDHMVKIFEAAQLNAIHGKQVTTLLPKDMQLSKCQSRIFDDTIINIYTYTVHHITYINSLSF